ncbi:MAG: DUF5615 family PIN-like protein [Bacteroidetes bacterium]|nr:DUF5615 family PIN-like protein [Bacteroidota bacterium]
MRFLFDQNISCRIIAKLPDAFTGCKHVSQVGLNDHEDIDIWQYAYDNDYSIVTFDSDFYDISLIIVFRFNNLILIPHRQPLNRHQITPPDIAVVEPSEDFKTSVGIDPAKILCFNE